MNSITPNLPHMIIAVVVIAAATVLGALHVIDGQTTVGLIGVAGGVSLGVGASKAP